MKYRGKKIIIGILICILSVTMCNMTFAHSGKTDSSGGHKDNKNKSGLGSYHYHCGGHPAHLHKNGVCPYSSNKSKTTKKSTKTTSKPNSSSSSTKEKSSTTNSNSKAQKDAPSTTLVYDDKQENINSTVKTVTNKNKQNYDNTLSNTGSENSNTLGAIIMLGALGGGSYLGYKRHKKSKK